VSLIRANQPGGGTVDHNALALYAPHVNPGTSAQPTHVAGAIGKAAINRGTDIMQPLAVNSRLTPSPATEAQVQQARLAQGHAPASAKVVTDSASVKPVLQAPLSSLKPMVSATTPGHTFNTSPNGISHVERVPSTPGVAPTERTFPQTGERGGNSTRVFSPGGSGGSHQSGRPAGSSSASPAPTGTHPGTSGGGEQHSSGGGASHAQSSGGGGGGSHGGGNSQQNH